jgi:integrase
MAKLTKRFIDSLTPDPKRETWQWDDELPGFGIRVMPSGRKSYLIQYRAEGRTRRYTIGPHGRWTPDQARKEARRQLSLVDAGGNPSQDKKNDLKAARIKDLANRYLSEHAAVKKKASGYKRDKQLIDRFIIPQIGNIRVDALTRADVSRMHHNIGKKTPIQANRVLAVLSKMMTLSIAWGLIESGNPCKHIQRFRENKRERFLSNEELAKVGKALKEAEDDSRISPYAINAIRFLLLTGARLGEVLGLQWDMIDYERSCAFLPDSKTGQKALPLGAGALELLQGLLQTAGNPYVFPGIKFGKPLSDLKRPWQTIREATGLEDVRVHDLRHSWASQAAAAGFSLPIIGAVLGHTEAATTQRYAHLSNDPVLMAADAVSERITEAMGKEPIEKVVELPKRKKA